MSNAVVIQDFNQSRIDRGVRAWGRIKATSAEQRELWREVGEALLVGRKLHKADRAFSQWCKDVGFGDMRPPVRSDAMWWAGEVYTACNPEAPPDLTHPTHIRQWHRENKLDLSIPPELQDVKPTPAAPVLAQRDAEKVAKLVQRAASGDEGSETAARMVKGLAKKHGISEEELTEAAKNGAPDTFFRFTETQQKVVDGFRKDLATIVPDLEHSGVPREAIKALLIQLANTL